MMDTDRATEAAATVIAWLLRLLPLVAQATTAAPAQRLSREEMLAAMRRDYDVQYFVRGVGDMEAYAPDCVFAGDVA
jgi:hypothetical protein